MVGTPDEAIAKILAQHEVFRHDRTLMQMSVGDQPQAAILRSIELLGTVVAAKVGTELALDGPRAVPREGRRAGSTTGRLRIADGCRPCVSVIEVSNHLASRLGLGRVGRAPRHRARREDRAQRGERTIVVAAAGRAPQCVWRLGGNWRRALGVHEWFLRDGRRCRCEGADRGRRQQYDR